jgi:hypothetical protein
VAGGFACPDVLFRGRAELGDPSGRVRRNAYQAARRLDPAEAAALVQAAERIAAERAAAALARTVRDAAEGGAIVRYCAVVVGTFSGARLESILASHALAHAAEGRYRLVVGPLTEAVRAGVADLDLLESPSRSISRAHVRTTHSSSRRLAAQSAPRTTVALRHIVGSHPAKNEPNAGRVAKMSR